VNETEWLLCDDPHKMLAFLGDRARARKLRLFAVACSRRIWSWIDAPGRVAVETAEAFADGLASAEQLRDARLACRNAGGQASWYAAVSNPAIAAGNAARSAQAGAAHELVAQAALVRDIFGNPFHSLPVRAFPPHVVELAQVCYAAFPAVSDDFDILADALDERGEEQAAAHCREDTHVKGCHVLDWILQKD
jgi:hypothetical protein